MSRWPLQMRAVVAVLALVGIFTMPQWLRRDGADLEQKHQAGLSIVIRTMRHLQDTGSVQRLINRLRDAGVTEAWIQFKQDESDEVTGGLLFYPSNVGPVAAGFEDDRLGQLVQGLSDAGVRVCAWVPCLNDSTAWEAHPDWRAWKVDDDGQLIEQENWLCPSSEAAVEHQAEIVGEIAERYPQISALYTDFIRYDNDFSCVCERCMRNMQERFDDESPDRPQTPGDILKAAKERNEAWQEWTDMRAETICDVVDALRDSIEEVRPDLWFGACVLPFSASDYSFNTQSGQDYYEMARVGLDEIAIMGYWDDWQKSPQWLGESLKNARELVRDECELSCIMDGDMSIRRTWMTHDAIRSVPLHRLRYFNYWEWREGDFSRLAAAERGALAGAPPRPEFTGVVIRIDTEPDSDRRYDTLNPKMIADLVDLFASEGVKATFVTCGKLAELQTEAVRFAQQHGHEIACHAYDHEQLDDLDSQEERRIINLGLDTLVKLGFDVRGFGAPRNSMTESGRDVLIERNLEYDGSSAYDPMEWLEPVDYALHSSGDGRKIIVIPFIMPNDWDALSVAGATVDQMEQQWRKRLDRVVELGEPAFVLDVHQWMAAKPEELAALQRFIHYAKSKEHCRVLTLREAAAHCKQYIANVEHAARSAPVESGAGR